MSIDLDLHPDELVHKARRGRPLTREQQRHLDDHFRDCATCRFVRDAGCAFDSEDAEAPPALVDALVDRTMQRLRVNAGRARRPLRRRLAAGATMAVAMIGGVAFAGYWGSHHSDRAPRALEAITDSAPPRKHHGAVTRTESADVAAQFDVPMSPPPTSVAAMPIVDRSARVVASRATVERRLASARPDDETAARLFEIANRARRQGDVAAVETAYEKLWTKFRASPEALASRAIAGQWMLDRGKPRAAIDVLRQYLAAAPAGELEEDVLVALADAHESIGDSPAAVATWRRLLAEHPGSVHAARARDGLRRLQPRTALSP